MKRIRFAVLAVMSATAAAYNDEQLQTITRFIDELTTAILTED